jgi:hypothetical protein
LIQQDFHIPRTAPTGRRHRAGGGFNRGRFFPS